ncbi:uncharacterized protein LOC117169791 [Belonocnema kinseyi]|uniref:uncharacterized protein LOC117169791 n=1 Tax=Belonocnema kinseyi TaxID=2817044 RepID=UPI00143DFC7C|nr:uncharacterized protein LOC117169791 [Belonocnema kinseyi]
MFQGVPINGIPSSRLKVLRGLEQDLNEFLALVPAKKIEEIVLNYLSSDEDLQTALEYVISDSFKSLIVEVESIHEVKVFVKYLHESGLDVYTLINQIHDFLGLDHVVPPTQRLGIIKITGGLPGLIADIKAVLPVKSLIVEVESINEVKAFVKYLHESGLDVYTLINQIHDFLGLDHVVPPKQRLGMMKITGGLPGLIADIKAVVPVEKIEALYQEKLVSSKDFATLIQRLGSPECQQIVNTVWGNEKLQELISRAEAKGVDVRAILNLITEILGIKFPTPKLRSMKGLTDDLEDFLALIPKEEIEEIVLDYLSSDEDFQAAVEYILSDAFKSLIVEVESINEVKAFFKYLHESGLDVYTLIKQIHDFLGLDHVVPPTQRLGMMKITGGLPGLIADVKAVLPVEKIEALYQEKLVSSKDFAILIQRLGSPECQQIVDTVWRNEKLQDLISRAEAKGVDVRAILNLITEILGIKFPAPKLRFMKGLTDDLEDFLALIPKEEIEEIVLDYLSSDEDFQAALEYVLSDAFKSLIVEVESINEVKAFFKYLHESGLDVYTLINQIHDFLGLDHVVPPTQRLGMMKITGGLPGLIADIKAVLPVEKIEALYQEKLVSSKDFAILIQRLGSPECQQIVDTVWGNEKLQELISRAEAKGVDVRAILNLITEILGIKFPGPKWHLTRQRNLKDDLDDLLELIPNDKILEVALEYLALDEDFQSALEYIISVDFAGFILDVESIEGVCDFLEYLQESGLDIHNFLNKLHESLELEPLYPLLKAVKVARLTGGLPGFLEDIKEILPLKDIVAVYKEKLETSVPLKDLLRRIQSPEFQVMIDVLMENEKLVKLMDEAETRGVDVNIILQTISKILGIKLPSRPRALLMSTRLVNEDLIADLKEIVDLIPTKKITRIVLRYAVSDKDFQRVMKYMLSDKFHTLIRNVEETPEMKDFLMYFNDIGLDVYRWIKIFHKVIQMDDLKVRSSIFFTGGIPSLIKDIREVLPLEKLYALYDEKLANSPAFSEFVERLRSQELQKLINTLSENNEVQRLLDTLDSMGLDVDAIFNLLSDFFGILFPERPIY